MDWIDHRLSISIAKFSSELTNPSNELAVEQKAEKIAEIMRSFNFLCQMDDLCNETQSLSEHFSDFLRSGVYRPSEVQTIRREFYEIVSALLVIDEEEGPHTSY